MLEESYNIEVLSKIETRCVIKHKGRPTIVADIPLYGKKHIIREQTKCSETKINT